MVIIENLLKVTQIDLMPIVECLQHELARYIQYPFFKGAEFVFAELKSWTCVEHFSDDIFA